MNNLIKAMDLNEYNSQLCRSGCSLQHLETMGNISGLAVQDLYSGSILKPTVTEKKDMMSLVEQYRGLQNPSIEDGKDKWNDYYKERSRILSEGVDKLVGEEKVKEHATQGWGKSGYLFRHERNAEPSTLEVVEYESTKHDHLPDYARAMIEMIEEAEYEMLHDYITSKDEWHRDVRIEEDGTETITWIHKSELVDDALRDYEKFLVDGSILLEEEKGVELPWEGETIALGKMFNLSVGDCK